MVNNQFAMHLSYLGFVFLLVVILWIQYFNKKKLIEELSLKGNHLEIAITEIKKNKKPKSVWCELHGKRYCHGYAAQVLITHDGLLVEPIEPKDRVITLISELKNRGIPVEFGSPEWVLIPGQDSKVLDFVFMLGAMYSFPKKEKIN
ncbi:MAG: hypothetical protein WCK60_02120 [Candidatus Nomurabacteria bacterium]